MFKKKLVLLSCLTILSLSACSKHDASVSSEDYGSYGIKFCRREYRGIAYRKMHLPVLEEEIDIMMKSGKRLLLVTGCMLSLFMIAPAMNVEAVDNVLGVETAYASDSTFSSYWFQDTDGSWKVRDGSGNIVKNAWLCDDAVASNGQNVWYLLDSNGNMLTSGLVQDQTGNYYSLETSHNGYYGMLRYQSNVYDGVNLSLESGHSGGFAKILNQDGIEALKSKYGVTSVSIDNSNCVYTSTFGSSSGGGHNSSSSNVSQPSSGTTTNSGTNTQNSGNHYSGGNTNANGVPNLSAITGGVSHADVDNMQGGDSTGLPPMH